MSYKIKHIESDPVTYEITFNYSKKNAIVDVELFKEDTLWICSRTDGYHWLHYWLSHEPDAKEMHNLPHEIERNKVFQLFLKHKIAYEPEDKETAFLKFPENFSYHDLHVVAQIIEPRFAVRERFFDGDE